MVLSLFLLLGYIIEFFGNHLFYLQIYTLVGESLHSVLVSEINSLFSIKLVFSLPYIWKQFNDRCSKLQKQICWHRKTRQNKVSRWTMTELCLQNWRRYLTHYSLLQNSFCNVSSEYLSPSRHQPEPVRHILLNCRVDIHIDPENSFQNDMYNDKSIRSGNEQAYHLGFVRLPDSYYAFLAIDETDYINCVILQ